jgi:hypothetical protein
MSFVGHMFSKPKPHLEPPPSRDDAADALQRREEEERKRRGLLAGGGVTQLTGTGGVPSELTGTRMLTRGY